MKSPKRLLALIFLIPNPGVILAAPEPGTLNLEPGTASEARPNIILVLTDDQRWDAMGFMGHPFLETPHMDRLARDGVHFKNAFVTTSLCSPSRASILTGLYTHNHRVADNYNPLPDDLVFFPEYLRESGYETAFVGKWHMGGDIDHPQPGFDHWISFKGQGIYFTSAMKRKVEGRFVPQASEDGYNINGRRVPQEKYITDELTDFSLEWLEGRHNANKAAQPQPQPGTLNPEPGTGKTAKPFFLYLSHKAVHADFLPANRHAFKYENEPVPAPHVPDDSNVPMWVKNQRNSRHGVEFAYYTDLDMAQYYRRYCETLLGVDESLGRLLTWLEKSGNLDDTILLYLGDNGFLFGEHGLIDKRNAYEESMRIPMLMHCPSLFKAGTRVDEVVATIDVAPTLLEAAGLPAPGHMDGTSFLPLARGESIPWRDGLLYEYMWERNYPQTPTTHAVRAQRYKYIRYHGIWDLDELYDLQEDPKETVNLIDSPDHREVVAHLNARLFELLAESGGDAMPLAPDRGTKFLHRKRGGTAGAPFPAFLREKPGLNDPRLRNTLDKVAAGPPDPPPNTQDTEDPKLFPAPMPRLTRILCTISRLRRALLFRSAAPRLRVFVNHFAVTAVCVICGSISPAAAQSPFAKLEGVRGFLYVEPFEIRKEFVLPLRHLSDTLDLSPGAALDAAAREKLLATLRNRLGEACPISADGAPLAFEFDRIDFVLADPKSGVAPDTRETIPVASATVAAVYVVTRDAPPARLEITWDLFPHGGKAVSVGVESSSGTSMDFFNEILTFTPDKPSQGWDLPDLGAAPALLAVSAPPRISHIPHYIAGLVLILSTLIFARAKRGPLRLAALVIGLAATFTLVTGFNTSKHSALRDDDARALVDVLLRNVYHAFAYRDESRIFDTLSASVAGDLLEKLYLDIRRGLELESAGGPRVKIHRVRLEECVIRTSAPPVFRAEARWSAAGNVSHWGHIHPRRNQYHGELTIEPVDGRWKVTSVDIFQEDRM